LVVGAGNLLRHLHQDVVVAGSEPSERLLDGGVGDDLDGDRGLGHAVRSSRLFRLRRRVMLSRSCAARVEAATWVSAWWTHRTAYSPVDPETPRSVRRALALRSAAAFSSSRASMYSFTATRASES